MERNRIIRNPKTIKFNKSFYNYLYKILTRWNYLKKYSVPYIFYLNSNKDIFDLPFMRSSRKNLREAMFFIDSILVQRIQYRTMSKSLLPKLLKLSNKWRMKKPYKETYIKFLFLFLSTPEAPTDYFLKTCGYKNGNVLSVVKNKYVNRFMKCEELTEEEKQFIQLCSDIMNKKRFLIKRKRLPYMEILEKMKKEEPLKEEVK